MRRGFKATRAIGSANQSPQFKPKQRPQLQPRFPKVPRPLGRPLRQSSCQYEDRCTAVTHLFTQFADDQCPTLFLQINSRQEKKKEVEGPRIGEWIEQKASRARWVLFSEGWQGQHLGAIWSLAAAPGHPEAALILPWPGSTSWGRGWEKLEGRGQGEGTDDTGDDLKNSVAQIACAWGSNFTGLIRFQTLNSNSVPVYTPESGPSLKPVTVDTPASAD